ncbi:uncharacterized protein LOC116853592 [Odontomachus brunneus]|uniref:uncharacterized protein LOC116853592 n=1 Tax=Odontomachus brunneus TaxID=486640 RepID=UPI0013F24C6C|nr:uncharacterized protein LOC116853592 [Odontomachus brunneus]
MEADKAENIGTLRRRRGATKAKLTRLIAKIEQLRTSGEVSKELIEEYVASLERIRVNFDRIQDEIVEMTGGEVTVADSSEEAYFEDRHVEVKVLLSKIMRDLPTLQDEASSMNSETIARVLQQQSELIQHVSRQSSTLSPSTDNNDAIARAIEQQTELLSRIAGTDGVANRTSGVKLPPVQLPTFDGRPEEWKRFADTFRSLINDKRDILPVQKFQYLATSLIGDAARVIDSIELTADNYTIAWELLQKRYDDPRAIKKKHIECLFRMPIVKRESATAIRELIDYTMKHLRVLKAMELPTDSWDELIVHMMETKLDAVSLRAWEQEGNTNALVLENLINFLQKRCQTLERLEARESHRDAAQSKDEDHKSGSRQRNQKPVRDHKAASLTMLTNTNKCFLCKGEHFLYHCKKFIAMPVDERIKEVRRLKLCLNCLRNDHYVKSCKMGSCRECSGRHNTLCHLPLDMKEKPTKKSVEIPSMSNANNESNDQVAIHLSANALAKRHVIIATARVYAILPNGSNVPCRILLDSGSEAHLVTSSACNKIGVRRNQSSEIITGINELTNQIHQGESLNGNLERFWEIENCNTYVRPIMSETEQKCEEIFELTTVRDNNGRFVVCLPIREDAEPLGESRGIAENRLRQLERRFKSNPSLREEYNKFMREYETLGHMSQVRDDEDRPNSQTVYLPHHCVVKESSSTTQYRAVFDASSKITSGRSLNDILMIGPTIQNSLIEIMIRFRMHKIALTGDIKKMYRQVIIDPQDRDYQRILWRYSLDEPIREYRLNTVTYGEPSPSYLAIKCICKLAEIGDHAYYETKSM